jgi:hypothetical protein
MRTSSLVLGACCLALSLATPLSGAIAAKAQKQEPIQPIQCLIAKKPICKAGWEALCDRLNKCGSGCIKWDVCRNLGLKR